MTIPPHSLLTRSLREKPWGYKVSRILAASLAAVDPSVLIHDLVTREENILSSPGSMLDLDQYNRIILLGIGKAALSMTESMGDLLGDDLTEGYILTKKGKIQLPEKHQDHLQVYTGNHPIPGEDSLQATSEILSRLSSLNDDDLVIVLISGGSSALFVNPAEGISLSDLKRTNQVLLSCGADIREINTVRKHLSRVKGGQLARILQPARIFTLILSDVIGDQIDLIGSGPTAPDPSTFADALNIIGEYHLEDQVPGPVITHIKQGLQGKLTEPPEPNDPLFKNVTNQILARNEDALRAGAIQAAIEGFSADTLPFHMAGEASLAGKNLAKRLSEMAFKNQTLRRPACLITGGETTVTLTNTGEPGQGGRNLELALSAMPILDGLSNVALITLATDGEDGSTYAAGAVVTGESFQRCQQLGLNPSEYLQRHDSYAIFHKLDDLLLTGPTGTNVNDLCFLFTF